MSSTHLITLLPDGARAGRVALGGSWQNRSSEPVPVRVLRELRSLKDGKHRRILPQWVDEYVARKAKEWAA